VGALVIAIGICDAYQTASEGDFMFKKFIPLIFLFCTFGLTAVAADFESVDLEQTVTMDIRHILVEMVDGVGGEDVKNHLRQEFNMKVGTVTYGDVKQGWMTLPYQTTEEKSKKVSALEVIEIKNKTMKVCQWLILVPIEGATKPYSLDTTNNCCVCDFSCTLL